MNQFRFLIITLYFCVAWGQGPGDVLEPVVTSGSEESEDTIFSNDTVVSDSNETTVSDNNETATEPGATLAPTTSEPTREPSKVPTLFPSISAAPTGSAAPTINGTLPDFTIINETVDDSRQNGTNATLVPSASPSISPPTTPPVTTPQPSNPSPNQPANTGAPAAPTLLDPALLDQFLCQNNNRRIGGFDAGTSHNQALEEAEVRVGEQNPVDLSAYVLIIEDQARGFCKGDPDCNDGLSEFTRLAVEYVEREEASSTQRNGGRRHLTEVLPENELSDRTLEVLERVLFHINLGTEFEVITALEGLETELSDDTSHGRKLGVNEKRIVDAAISVAKASTSYWHKAYREDSNSYRRLQRTNLIDCLFTGVRPDDNRRNLRSNLLMQPIQTSLPRQSRRLKKKSKKGYGHSHGHKPDKDKNNQWMDPCAHCDSWQRCEQCYNAYNLNGAYNYNYGMIQGYHYGNMGYYQGYGGGVNVYNGGYGGYGGYGGRYDDFFWTPDKDKSDSKDEDTDGSITNPEEEEEGLLGGVGNFLFNVAYVVRADVVGVVVGIIVGQGCLLPATAAAFLFSALYAICYRRTN